MSDIAKVLIAAVLLMLVVTLLVGLYAWFDQSTRQSTVIQRYETPAYQDIRGGQPTLIPARYTIVVQPDGCVTTEQVDVTYQTFEAQPVGSTFKVLLLGGCPQ
jgi:hypothetical protein